MSGDVERVAAQLHHEGWPIEPDWKLTPETCETCAKVLRQAQVLLAPGGVVAGMVTERDRLRQWKQEALPVLDGLQELGRALDLPLGERITGTRAVKAAEAMRAERDRAAEMRARIEALVPVFEAKYGVHSSPVTLLRAALADPDTAAPGPEPATGAPRGVGPVSVDPESAKRPQNGTEGEK
jgi:hypothetical protein